MRLLIDLGGRYERTPDGAIWAKSGCLYKYWTRYLAIFDEVCLVARARDVNMIPEGVSRVDGPGVTFAAVPHFHGSWQYAAKFWSIHQAAKQSLSWGDAVILSCGPLTDHLGWKLHQWHYPYAMRVIGDPYMVLGATSHPLRAFFRWWFSKQLRHLCAGACAVTYVTEHALQKRYPCPGYSVGVSDVDLPPSAFVTEPRKPHTDSKPLRLILVGSLAELYKAPHILIDAFSRCINDGFNLELVFVGDGKHRSELEAQAKRLGLAKRVVFCGQLSNDQVQSQLDQADLFILASIQEGLPRAMVEAMARGLPCIGSTVGGIPELLPAEDLVPSGDTDALARKINEVVSNSERMECMSKQNLARASDFREELLMAKWSEFYNYLKERTQEWLAANARQDSFT